MQYFVEYKTAPTLEVLKVKTDEIQNDVLKVAVVESLKESWRHIEATDLDFVKEQVLGFCKNQTLKNAIIESVDFYLNTGQMLPIYFFVEAKTRDGSEPGYVTEIQKTVSMQKT